MDISNCIPKDKFDIAAIELAGQIGFPALNPILPDLLKWVQDINWPVARETAALLSNSGLEILPHIKAILSSDDGIWKYWTIDHVIRNASSDVLFELCDDLMRLIENPTQDDQREEVNAIALSILTTREIQG
jgi:hypothetical protein